MNRTLEYAQQNFAAGLTVLCSMKAISHYIISSKYSLAHNPERAPPMLSLCYGVYTERFISRRSLEHAQFPAKMEALLFL